MNTIILNNSIARFHIIDQGMMLKAACLISDQVCSTSFDHFYIIRERLIENSTQSPRFKLNFIANNSLDPDTVKCAEDIMIAHKKLTLQKRRSNDVVKLLKKIEHTADTLFKITLEEAKERWANYHVAELAPLIGELLWELPMSDTESKPLPEYLAPSEVLKLVSGGKPANNEILFLPSRFWGDVYEDNSDSMQENIAHDKTVACFFPAFEIAGCRFLNDIEIRAIRAQTQEARKEFCKAMDQWLALASEDSSALDDITLYKTQIEEKASVLNDALRMHPLMKLYNSNTDQHFRVQLGAVPVQTIWRYYSEKGLVDEATLIQMLEACNEPRYSGRWPVLSYRIPKSTFTENTAEDPVLIKKKSIGLD